MPRRLPELAMRTLSSAVVVVFAAFLTAAPVPLPSAREAEQLVEKLGSQDYAEREAATKRLDELGALALDALRAACRSENPEVADRAKDLVRKIERRVASDSTLAPTMVELGAKDAALDEVLAALSKQAGCEVVLGGLNPEELAAKKITVATNKVPFWTAVLKVCDAAGLQIAGAGGFLAPGAMPYRPRADAKIRVATDVNAAVILEARDGTKPRPASVHGAILVEAHTPSGKTSGSAAALQLWPEPKVPWQHVVHVRVAKATDGDGRKLVPDLALPPAPAPKFFPGGKFAPESVTDPRPNPREALVKFKPGEEPAQVARELTGTALGWVRSAPEPLVTVALDPKKAVKATGRAGVELTATVRTENGKPVAEVWLAYDPLAVEPVRTTDSLSDVATERGSTNRTVHGLRVADADGRAFAPSLAASRSDFTWDKRIELKLTLALPVEEKGPTEPGKVVFWGTFAKPVEVPFALKDVPLTGR
jgi:hypothetical protein